MTMPTWIRPRTLLFPLSIGAGAVFGACSSGDAAPGISTPDAAVEADAGPPLDAGYADSTAADSAAASPCEPLGDSPPSLECTGLYSDFATKAVAATARPYAPAVPFWSDGAEKLRWISLPAGSMIDTTDMSDWKFPVGTKIWKEFKLNGKRIETRFMVKLPSEGWEFATYLWNKDESAAPLHRTGVRPVEGTTYEVPSVHQCMLCHSGSRDRVLGFQAVSLGLAGASGITLETLVAESKLTNAPPSTSVEIPGGGSTTAASALAWLNVNCGVSCHNSGTGEAAFRGLYLKIRTDEIWPAEGGAAKSIDQLDAWTTSVGIASTQQPPMAATTYERIKRGSPDESMIVYYSARREDTGGYVQMPPIVTHTVDTAGVQLLRDWIGAIAP